jgi:predicted LPLAT superfamily acyltransferase
MSVTAQQEWLTRAERSNRAAIKFIVWVAQRLGRPMARLLLYPTCVYFVLFCPAATTSSRKFLAKILHRPAGFSEVFRHYYFFAAILLDRVFLLGNQSHIFDIEIHGEDLVAATFASGQGCFMVGAHLGSFEVVRTIGRRKPGLGVRLVMYDANARKINSVLSAINPELSSSIIGLGHFDSMLKVEESLGRGEFVCLLADRGLEGERLLHCPFLGELAPFPLGPFRVAALLKRPVVLMFGIYRGGSRYDVHFETLIDFTDVERAQRSQMVEEAVRRYVVRLEHQVRAAPYNWLNFYDFWK